MGKIDVKIFSRQIPMRNLVDTSGSQPVSVRGLTESNKIRIIFERSIIGNIEYSRIRDFGPFENSNMQKFERLRKFKYSNPHQKIQSFSKVGTLGAREELQ